MLIKRCQPQAMSKMSPNFNSFFEDFKINMYICLFDFPLLQGRCHENDAAFSRRRRFFRHMQQTTNWFYIFAILRQSATNFRNGACPEHTIYNTEVTELYILTSLNLINSLIECCQKHGLVRRRRRNTLEKLKIWKFINKKSLSVTPTQLATFPARLIAHSKFRLRLRQRMVLACLFTESLV